MHMWNMKAIPLLVKKIWPSLKLYKSRSIFKLKVTRSKFLVPMERSCHKECTYIIWKPYLFWLGSYGQGYNCLKVGQTSRSRLHGQKARCVPLFFFQQCFLVGIRLCKWGPTIRMNEARRMKWSILLSDNILIFSLFVGCFYRKRSSFKSYIQNSQDHKLRWKLS